MPRYVLTGTPGSGKTAVLRLLERMGYPVIEEAATDVIALEQALGGSEPWRSPGFIDKIAALQVARQAASPAGPWPVFFDRSPVCTLALARFLGFPAAPSLLAEVARLAREQVYQTEVFFVRNQGFVAPTAARRISFADSLAFEEVHEQTYAEFGFRLVEVPAGPLPDRAAAVLSVVAPARPRHA
ncbi:MAG: AAA family ATPase [Streptosporangiaceae bacterium]